MWYTTEIVAQIVPSSQNRIDREAADTYFAQAKTALKKRDTETVFPLIHIADSLYQKLAFPQEVIKTKL